MANVFAEFYAARSPKSLTASWHFGLILALAYTISVGTTPESYCH